jgi:hypothetical protein
MPSKSEKQRKFFGAVKGAKKGSSKVSGAAKKVAKEMPEKEIDKFLKKKPKKAAKKAAKKATKKTPTSKKKKPLTESNISLFIDCILEKKYDDASKYLTSILNSKLQTRIEKELATPLF